MKERIFTAAILILVTITITFAINPMREYRMTPESLKLNFQEMKIPTSDDCLLHTWLMQPKTKSIPNVTFLLVGSDAGNMGYSLPYATQLLRSGYPVVTFDYRGFGKSDDYTYHENYLYETDYQTDLIAVLNYVKKVQPEQKICIIAFSMGTWIAASIYQQHPFDGMVAEACLYRPDLVAERIKNLKDEEIILPKPISNADMIYGKLNIPMLIFAAREDEITTLSDSNYIAKLRKNRRVINYAGGHLEGLTSLGLKNYITEITNFATLIE